MMWSALWLDKGFLVGEPFDHRNCKEIGRVLPTYAAFIHHNEKFFEGPNLTAPEFRAFDVRPLPASSDSAQGKLHGSSERGLP